MLSSNYAFLLVPEELLRSGAFFGVGGWVYVLACALMGIMCLLQIFEGSFIKRLICFGLCGFSFWQTLVTMLAML